MAGPQLSLSPEEYPELYTYGEQPSAVDIALARSPWDLPAYPQFSEMQGGAVESAYPLETAALGGGGAKIAQSLLSQAVKRAVEARLTEEQPLMVGPPMQVMEREGYHTPIPRNARLRQIDRALGEFGRFGRQVKHNRMRGSYNPAGKDQPPPLTPQEIAEIWNRINPKWPVPVPRTPPVTPSVTPPVAPRVSPATGQRPWWDWGI